MKTKLGKLAVSWGVWVLLWLCSTAGYAQNQLENTGGRCDTVRFVVEGVWNGIFKFDFCGTEGAVFYVEAVGYGQRSEYNGKGIGEYVSVSASCRRSNPDTVLLYSASSEGRVTSCKLVHSEMFININSLDVSGCTALESLDCGAGYLDSLDVSDCTALEYLDCSNNSLTSLDVSGCTALESLDCGANGLNSLDVSGCTALKSLNCANNRLTSLDLSGYTALKSLNCANNRLTSLDLSGYTALESLDCSGAEYLNSLDVSGCTALDTLDCHWSRLSSLDVSGCTALEYLDCYNNQLTSLDLSDCTELDLLECYDNWLSELHFEGNQWSEMYIYNNRLRLNVCYEWSKRCAYSSDSDFKGANQYIPVSLEVDEPYDLHADMELGGQRTEIRVTRKGGGYLDPKLYKVENDWLIFSERGEYTVEMTNSQVRNSGSPLEKIFVFLDIRVGMGDAPDDPSDPDNPSDPNDPDDPTAPDDPTNPDDPTDPDDPTKPGDTTANEALGVLTSAALQVYPNPATDVLHVALRASGKGASAAGSAVHAGNAPHASAPAASENLRTVRILSVGGHLYRSFTSGFESLPVGDLPAGIYLLEAETTAGTVLRQKFVKR